MKWILFSLALFFVSLNPGIFASVQKPESIEDLVKRFKGSQKLKSLQHNGGAIVILYKNEVLYKEVFGYKKNKSGKITQSTLFPLASSSKPISATLVAYLAKQGRLSLDETLSPIVGKIDPRVKLRQVLSHSSGYHDSIGNRAIESGESRENLLQLISSKTAESLPGTKYYYSNVLFSLLEEVIQKRTDLSFEANMRNFLTKIGIEGEEICKINQVDLVASPHKKIKNKLKSRELPKYYPNSVCSAAGLFLSIDQIANFLKLAMGQYPQVLNKDDLEVVFQPQVEVRDIFWKWPIRWPFPPEQLKSSYALGWRILERTSEKQNRLVFHSGHLNGVTTFVGVIPEKELGIAILSNQDFVSSEEAGFDFWKLALRSTEPS